MKKSIFRKSQITRSSPTRRLVKRRKVQARSPKRGFFPNPKGRAVPRPLLYIITAKAGGRRMHYDGSKFSERERVKTYATADKAAKTAYELVRRFPVLRKYRIEVRPNF